MNAKLIQGAAGRVFSVVGDRYHFLVTGDGAGRMIVVVTPAGFEKFFAEIGTPLASPHDAPVEPTPVDIERLVAAAPRYGLEMLTAAHP